jgi:hypothetical protein
VIKLQYLEKDLKPVLANEELSEISNVLEAKFKPFLKNEVFLVEAGCNALQTQMKCTLAKNDGSIAYPVEAVCILRSQDAAQEILSAKDQAFAILDMVDAYWTEYLQQGRDTFLGLDWEAFEHGPYTICLRGFMRNLEVERLTDEWLQKAGHGNYDIEPISSTW